MKIGRRYEIESVDRGVMVWPIRFPVKLTRGVVPRSWIFEDPWFVDRVFRARGA